MKNKELYDRTVSILVDAYMSGDLKYEDCERCAVGNLVAASLGVKPQYGITDDWANAVSVATGHLYPPDKIPQSALDQIALTGYTPQEVADIELAFYMGVSKKIFMEKDEENFEGLMSVVECLDIIHENTDTAITTSSKSRFTKQLA
jgi:hypothetical protein